MPYGGMALAHNRQHGLRGAVWERTAAYRLARFMAQRGGWCKHSPVSELHIST
jgi:hypothetical protein